VEVAADGVTFFVGSLFFTTAAVLQYRQTDGREERGRTVWWAALVQLVGTVLFNISTYDAMCEHLSATQENHLVWTPDVLGSICFLVASGLAWIAVSRRLWSWHPRNIPWVIAVANLAGSVAFGVSAAAARIVCQLGSAGRWVALFLAVLLNCRGSFGLASGRGCSRW